MRRPDFGEALLLTMYAGIAVAGPLVWGWLGLMLTATALFFGGMVIVWMRGPTP